MKKKKVAVRMCSGCVCEFDRRGVLDLLVETFGDTCEFKYSYNLKRDADFDLALQIHGCDSECAEASEVIENVVIDHKNWESAVGVFGEAVLLTKLFEEREL